MSRPLLTRLEDWPERLEAAFAAAAETPFSYGGFAGGHDCALHAADCILAVTGHDVAAPWRQAYATAEEGMALVARDLGAKSLVGLASKLLPRRHTAFARRGDVGLALAGVGGAGVLVVFDGPHVRGAMGQLLPRAAAVRAWGVG